MDKNLKKIIDAPSEVLEGSVSLTQKITREISHNKITEQTKKYWKTLGPGLVTGASDDDPSGIATYSQTGAKYGLQLLWLSLFTFPFMAMIQEMCARIALSTGRGLASNIKRHYSVRILYMCMTFLFIANTFNIGADLSAMASAVQLLAPGFGYIPLVVIFGVGILLLEIFLSYRTYAKYLKWLSFVLLAYVASMFFIKFDWHAVAFHTLVPSLSFNKDMLLLVTAILGTTISPYLFFWQTSQEVEEEILEGKTTLAERQHATKKDIKRMRVDIWSGMFLSNFVMFCIIAVCGATLYAHGITNIETASDAALALKPLAGNAAYVLFALGIIGTGLLAIPVLAASASYTVAESFSWKEGLYRKLRNARSFYGVMILSVFLGLLLNFFKIDPIKTLIYSAVANGVIAPIIMVCIVSLSSNKKIMGEHANRKSTNFFGWLVTGLMGIASIATLISLFI